LSNQARATSLSYFGGKLAHGFLGDHAAFTPRKGSTGVLKSRQKFKTLALPVFPQGERFLYRFFLTAYPSTFYGTANECLLVGDKLNFHVSTTPALSIP